MSIKVTMAAPEEMHPFIVEFADIKRLFTKKAAIELKNKLRLALDEFEVYEAMKDAD